MDRRTFVISSSVAALVAASGRVSAQTSGKEAELNAAFETIFQRFLDISPELVTSLGLDKGSREAAKSQLDDDSASGTQKQLQMIRKGLAELSTFKGADLAPASALNLEVVTYFLQQQTLAPSRFGIASVGRPYRIFQQGGAYFQLPDFLNTAHTIASSADCEAYLARLEAFAVSLDSDSAVQREEASRGYLAPAFSLDLTLGQMAKLRGQKSNSSSIVQSLVTRAGAKAIAGDWEARAAAIVDAKVYPALDRQIELIKALRTKTAAGDGLWRVPQGDAIYSAALKQWTTTDFPADEVHRMGLTQVAEITAQLDTILKAQGMTNGSVASRLAALNVNPDQLYSGTPEGKASLIAGLNESVKAMYVKLPQAFEAIPKTPLEIRAVPVEIQDGASNGYYNRASLDGSRPAIYFINLKDVGDWPKYGLPSLTYHEGVPGHHLQISTAQTSGDIPTLRKIGGFSAYSEGWALYAEQLADELGAYATPLERAGYLQSFLFRAARLVVDTGIHTKRWSREQATEYLVQTTGFAAPRSKREVERYCTQPGQACSYKVGHAAWLRARSQTQAALGEKFNLRHFHEILRDGAMPLSILERRIAERTRAAMAAS